MSFIYWSASSRWAEKDFLKLDSSPRMSFLYSYLSYIRSDTIFIDVMKEEYRSLPLLSTFKFKNEMRHPGRILVLKYI